MDNINQLNPAYSNTNKRRYYEELDFQDSTKIEDSEKQELKIRKTFSNYSKEEIISFKKSLKSREINALPSNEKLNVNVSFFPDDEARMKISELEKKEIDNGSVFFKEKVNSDFNSKTFSKIIEAVTKNKNAGSRENSEKCFLTIKIQDRKETFDIQPLAKLSSFFNELLNYRMKGMIPLDQAIELNNPLFVKHVDLTLSILENFTNPKFNFSSFEEAQIAYKMGEIFRHQKLKEDSIGYMLDSLDEECEFSDLKLIIDVASTSMTEGARQLICYKILDEVLLPDLINLLEDFPNCLSKDIVHIIKFLEENGKYIISHTFNYSACNSFDSNFFSKIIRFCPNLIQLRIIESIDNRVTLIDTKEAVYQDLKEEFLAELTSWAENLKQLKRIEIYFHNSSLSAPPIFSAEEVEKALQNCMHVKEFVLGNLGGKHQDTYNLVDLREKRRIENNRLKLFKSFNSSN